jgi:hypothetical protein
MAPLSAFSPAKTCVFPHAMSNACTIWLSPRPHSPFSSLAVTPPGCIMTLKLPSLRLEYEYFRIPPIARPFCSLSSMIDLTIVVVFSLLACTRAPLNLLLTSLCKASLGLTTSRSSAATGVLSPLICEFRHTLSVRRASDQTQIVAGMRAPVNCR